MSALSDVVRSFRTLHGIVSWGILRVQGCAVQYPLFLNTREITVGTGVEIERQCQFGGAIELDDHASIGRDTTMFGDVSVGRSTRLNPRCELRGNVFIGRYCAVARDVTFQEREHDQSYAAVQHPLYERVLDKSPPVDTEGEITVGNDVWIGSDALVLSGVNIGDGAVVAAKSVVTEDVEPYSVVAGVPASHKKYRFPADVREVLLDLQWWRWAESTIRDHAALFAGPLRSVSDVTNAVGECSYATENTNQDRG